MSNKSLCIETVNLMTKLTKTTPLLTKINVANDSL